MVTVPGFLLRRLYVKGSLENAGGGFEFELRNGLGSGYAYRMRPLILDGAELPAETASFVLDGKQTAFTAVSRENTFTLAMNKTIAILVDGTTLSPGPHKIGMAFDVPGLGTLRFDFTDTVQDRPGRVAPPP